MCVCCWNRTREGVVGVEHINLFPAVSVDVARRHSDGVALAISQGVERGAAVVDGDVEEPLPLLVVLQHQVGTVVTVGARRRRDVKRLFERLFYFGVQVINSFTFSNSTFSVSNEKKI